MKSLLLHGGLVVVVSHPSRGAWIEMPPGVHAPFPSLCVRRTPRGVRGLKWELGILVGKMPDVAPLAGCVD